MVRSRLDDAFLKELRAHGVSAGLCGRLAAFLRARHPGNQELVYHGLAHSYEVASLTARLLHSWPRVPPERKILLILAAALHDVDPERAPITLARVDATLVHLEKDRTARRLLKDFSSRFGFTPNQVLALVMATDYAPTAAEMKKKLKAFERAHTEAFGDDPWIADWGRRLAYWDQISTYLVTRELAIKRVAGLARELRHAHVGRLPAGGMRAVSHRFLSRLRKDPLFGYLPAADRRRFDSVLAEFAPSKAR